MSSLAKDLDARKARARLDPAQNVGLSSYMSPDG